MKKVLVIIYSVLFSIAWFGLVSAAGSSGSDLVRSNNSNLITTVVSEKAFIYMDYDLIAKKVFDKFIRKYPNFINQIACEDVDGYINKILKRTKIKFRKPDVNKENTIKHMFEKLLREYLDNNLECDDFIDVDRDEDEMTQEYVKCLFNNSNTIQSCYSSDGKWSCKWLGSCNVKIDWYLWEKIERKSSCGWYSYNIVNWENDYVKFQCPMIFQDCERWDGSERCANPVIEGDGNVK